MDTLRLWNIENPIKFDHDTNTLTINNADFPLTVKVSGPIIFEFADDVSFESDGQFDISTKNKMICLDSINSVIHLNSRKCKKISEDNDPGDDNSKDIKITHRQSCSDNHNLEAIMQLCDNINKRLVLLEQRSGGKNDSD